MRTRQRSRASSDRKRPEASRTSTHVLGLEQQNASLKKRLQEAETMLAIQARASRILGVALSREAEERARLD
jgi:hypothetical protein